MATANVTITNKNPDNAPVMILKSKLSFKGSKTVLEVSKVLRLKS